MLTFIVITSGIFLYLRIPCLLKPTLFQNQRCSIFPLRNSLSFILSLIVLQSFSNVLHDLLTQFQPQKLGHPSLRYALQFHHPSIPLHAQVFQFFPSVNSVHLQKSFVRANNFLTEAIACQCLLSKSLYGHDPSCITRCDKLRNN